MQLLFSSFFSYIYKSNIVTETKTQKSPRSDPSLSWIVRFCLQAQDVRPKLDCSAEFDVIEFAVDDVAAFHDQQRLTVDFLITK